MVVNQKNEGRGPKDAKSEREDMKLKKGHNLKDP